MPGWVFLVVVGRRGAEVVLGGVSFELLGGADGGGESGWEG